MGETFDMMCGELPMTFNYKFGNVTEREQMTVPVCTGTRTEERSEAVHRYIVCDKSGMNPIRGTRYHLAGCNYDLCEAEFNKVADEEKVNFVVIERCGDSPTPYGQDCGVEKPPVYLMNDVFQTKVSGMEEDMLYKLLNLNNKN